MVRNIRITAINDRTAILERNGRYVAVQFADAPPNIDPTRLGVDEVRQALADVIDSHLELRVMGWSALRKFLAVRGIDAKKLLARTIES